jgi:hypothetical protein
MHMKTRDDLERARQRYLAALDATAAGGPTAGTALVLAAKEFYDAARADFDHHSREADRAVAFRKQTGR